MSNLTHNFSHNFAPLALDQPRRSKRMPSGEAGITSVGELGTVLRRHREARGLLQEELAALVEPALSVNTIGNVERGRTRPHRHTLDVLAVALRLDAEQRAELTAAWRLSTCRLGGRRRGDAQFANRRR